MLGAGVTPSNRKTVAGPFVAALINSTTAPLIGWLVSLSKTMPLGSIRIMPSSAEVDAAPHPAN